MDADRLARLVRLARLLDRQDILDCLTRFSRGMDRFDRDLFVSAFHGDAVIAAGDFVGCPSDLYDWASARHEQGQVATHHNLLNNTCDIDGDTAHSETYYLFAARNRDDTNWIAQTADTSTGWSGATGHGESPSARLSSNGRAWCPRCRSRSPTFQTSMATARPHAATPNRHTPARWSTGVTCTIHGNRRWQA
jgi:SnoaL-like domain